jgi:hypothetical protein
MDDFPSNSRRAANEPLAPKAPRVEEGPATEGVTKLDKVVIGEVIRRKKPLGRRFLDTFFSGDSTSVVGYLTKEVLLPAMQNLITDFVTQGIERAVYGEVQTPRRTGPRGNVVGRPHVNYGTPSSIRPSSVRQTSVRTASTVIDLGDIVLPDLNQTQIVIDQLFGTAKEFGCASVANLKELIGEPTQYTDHKWGWYDLTGMDARRVRDGYLLIIPPVEDIR